MSPPRSHVCVKLPASCGCSAPAVGLTPPNPVNLLSLRPGSSLNWAAVLQDGGRLDGPLVFRIPPRPSVPAPS